MKASNQTLFASEIHDNECWSVQSMKEEIFKNKCDTVHFYNKALHSVFEENSVIFCLL